MSEPFTRLQVDELIRRRAEGWQPYVLDVRSQAEADEVSLPFTDRLHLHTDVARIAAELPTDRDIVVYCRGGARSAMAAATLASHGHRRLFNLEGGITAWLSQAG